MNISGVIVHCKPENLSGVQQHLTALPGVEVHAAGEDGRMVVTVEETSDRKMADTVSSLNEIKGVIATSMVYHHFEDLEENNELNQQEVSL